MQAIFRSLIPRLRIPALSVHEISHPLPVCATRTPQPDRTSPRQCNVCAQEQRRQKKRLEAEAALFQADVTLLAKDDVVKQLDLQSLSGPTQLFCRTDILR
jgi:hypothetical protein